MIVQPIVEGQGDVAASPVLLRRLAEAAHAWDVKIARPHRRPRTALVKKDTLQNAVRVARLTDGCGAILVLFDADDDCPKDLAPTLAAWAQEAARSIPCAVVMAKREYEAWLLAAIESMQGRAGVRVNAREHPDPEAPRDAKGELGVRMNCDYLPTVDQQRLSAIFDLASAYRRCRSFRKVVGAFGALLAAHDQRPAGWPPTAWLA